MKKIIFEVEGMHCPSCEMLVKDALEEQEGVNKAELSQKKGTAIIFFEEKKISEDKLKSIIKKEGYGVLSK
ncbi:heavy-metal-associated domain-containing protein [Candidatus Woesearchaeota archaeon]|nr:heavy-metal-associated domain-containing protein [Candidatus Woesearchaeota archaeon]